MLFSLLSPICAATRLRPCLLRVSRLVVARGRLRAPLPAAQVVGEHRRRRTGIAPEAGVHLGARNGEGGGEGCARWVGVEPDLGDEALKTLARPAFGDGHRGAESVEEGSDFLRGQSPAHGVRMRK